MRCTPLEGPESRVTAVAEALATHSGPSWRYVRSVAANPDAASSDGAQHHGHHHQPADGSFRARHAIRLIEFVADPTTDLPDQARPVLAVIAESLQASSEDLRARP